MQLTEHGESLLEETCGVITNDCTCMDYNEETDEHTPSTDCYGDCWDDSVRLFEEDTKELLAKSTTWEISGLPLWNRTIRGVAEGIETAEQLIRAITVNSSWKLRYKVLDSGSLWCYLSHHDATGSFEARPIEDTEDN